MAVVSGLETYPQHDPNPTPSPSLAPAPAPGAHTRTACTSAVTRRVLRCVTACASGVHPWASSQSTAHARRRCRSSVEVAARWPARTARCSAVHPLPRLLPVVARWGGGRGGRVSHAGRQRWWNVKKWDRRPVSTEYHRRIRDEACRVEKRR